MFSENVINYYRPENDQLVKYESTPILKGANSENGKRV